MPTAEFRSTISEPWTSLEPICVGDLQTVATPQRHVVVDTGKKLLRIDIYTAAQAFEEVVFWRELVVIGFGDQVFLVPTGDGEPKEIKVGTYFGHLYVEGGALLVASESRLLRVSPQGRVIWASVHLGIDGVIVDRIQNGVVYGEGEWDPPGGWKPFVLGLDTGRYVV